VGETVAGALGPASRLNGRIEPFLVANRYRVFPICRRRLVRSSDER
jgi:hypothetical protein